VKLKILTKVIYDCYSVKEILLQHDIDEIFDALYFVFLWYCCNIIVIVLLLITFFVKCYLVSTVDTSLHGFCRWLLFYVVILVFRR